MHPQHAINKLSLLASDSHDSLGNQDAQSFWLQASSSISWFKKPTIAYGQSSDESHTKPQWFPNATLNTCYNAIDRHVLAGHGARPCLHHYSPLPFSSVPRRSMTYAEVLQEVKSLAGVLKGSGVKKGDRVVIYVGIPISHKLLKTHPS